MSKNLLSILLIIIPVVLYLLVIKPVYTGVGGVWQPTQSVKDLSTLNEQYSATLDQAETLASQAMELEKEYQSVSQEDRDKMKIMVPDSIDRVRLLNEVSLMGTRLGFTLNDLSYAEGSSLAAGRGSATISFTVKTTYPRFKDLMDNFEKSLRLYTIQSVTFSAPEKEGDLTSYQVKLDTYYIK